MSTHECFERHLTVGRFHEDRGRMALEDATATWQRSQPSALWPSNFAGADSSDSPMAGAALGSDMRRAAKAVRNAYAQQRLAVREYREAVRLRPRNIAVKQQLRTAIGLERALEASLKVPKPKPLGRFLAHYNLCIRYWDLGKAKQALHEAEMACEELRRHGISGGCAEHNLMVIERVQADCRMQERALVEAAQRSPQAVEPNYRLGELYFDKRMLLKGEAQLRWTLERANAANALRNVVRDKDDMLRANWQQRRLLAAHGHAFPDPLDVVLQRSGAKRAMKSFELTAGVADVKLGICACGSPPDGVIVGKVTPGSWADAAGLRAEDEIISVNGRPLLEFDWGSYDQFVDNADFQRALRARPLTLVFSRNASGILADLQDDLDFVGHLREMWCVEEDAGKTDDMQATGVRDGQRPQLLPCLHRRFSQECGACDAWWAELCSRTDVDLCALPSNDARPPATPQRSASTGACRGGSSRGGFSSFAPPARRGLGGR